MSMNMMPHTLPTPHQSMEGVTVTTEEETGCKNVGIIDDPLNEETTPLLLVVAEGKTDHGDHRKSTCVRIDM